VSCKAIPSDEIPDETFAAGVLGRGVGIEPSEGVVVAPFDGEISTVAETKHAVGLSSPDGMELLIHIGVDTVAMGGDGFTALVQEGQKVKAGEQLVLFDREKIRKAGHPDCVVVLVTNSDEFESLTIQPGPCKAMDQIIRV
ncbi:MAG: PTS glucose transporter subunit IIA, partial [Oscillospiraceae bacterium]|nr:PTS glucose transporter subunit IIA [Oscillospiraceae bacterium]